MGAGPAGRVVRIDPARHRQARIATGPRPFGHASGAGSVWVTNLYSSTVARIDPSTNRVVARIPVGARPYGLALGGGGVWVSNSGEGTVSRIDPRTNRVVAKLDAGTEPNGLLAYGALWVGDYGGGRVRIDPGSDPGHAGWPIAHADWITASPGALWVSSEPGRSCGSTPRPARSRRGSMSARTRSRPRGSAAELWVPSIDADSISIVDPARTRSGRRARPAAARPRSRRRGRRVGRRHEDGDVWRIRP